MSESFTVRILRLLDGRVFEFSGRDAWALGCLVSAGDAGCTPIDHPGPRWSAYVHKLRRAGLDIQTIDERHGGPFAGHHARYVLRTGVRVLEIVRCGVAA